MTKLYQATRHDGSKVTFHALTLMCARRYCIMFLHFIPTLIEEV